jgi:hypothetical protein
LLAPVDLARLSSLAVRARTIVEGALSGVHRNLHPGTRLEFTEHKEYAPGDDVRRIDWKAVARTDRYTIKRFENETEMRMLLVLDTSASMAYRRTSVSKLEYATYLCAALAYLVGQQRDAAGLLAFDEGTRALLPPSTRPGQIREVLAALENLRPAGVANPGRAVDAVGEICDKRSLVILFSDLLDSEDAPTGATAKARWPIACASCARAATTWCCFTSSIPTRSSLPFEDLMFFEGMEPGDSARCSPRPATWPRPSARNPPIFRERWRTTCLEARVEYRFARTDIPPAEILHAFLADRAGRP